MIKPLSAEARAEWRAHWKLAVAAAAGASMMSIATTSLGAYMAPLEQEFGWSRTEVSSGLTIFAVAGILFAPLLGTVVDRWGPRRFGVPGIILCGLTFALFGTATASIAYWFVLWFVYSAAAQVSRPLVWSAAISSEFVVSRGTAMAVMMAGSGIGNLVAPVLAGYLISDFGWRLCYLITGLGWGVFSGLICYLWFYGRSDRLRGATVAQRQNEPARVLTGISARDAFRSLTFPKLLVAALLGHILIMGMWVHLIPILIVNGLPRTDAIWLGGILGIAATAGQLISGALADRFPGHLLSAGYVLCLALASATLLLPMDTMLLGLIPVVVLGLFGGAQTHILPYLTSRYFGLKAFGKLFGVIASVMGIAVALGPNIASYVFDRTQEYHLFLLGCMPAAMVTAVLIFSLGRYPDDPAKKERAAPTPEGHARSAA